MNLAAIKAAADQAAAAADDTGERVVVGKDEWFGLLDVIYDAEDDDES